MSAYLLITPRRSYAIIIIISFRHCLYDLVTTRIHSYFNELLDSPRSPFRGVAVFHLCFNHVHSVTTTIIIIDPPTYSYCTCTNPHTCARMRPQKFHIIPHLCSELEQIMYSFFLCCNISRVPHSQHYCTSTHLTLLLAFFFKTLFIFLCYITGLSKRQFFF
jgi:hypothetical protein